MSKSIEFHQGAAVGKLPAQPLMLRAGQQIGIHQLALPLTVPELGEVSHMDALCALFAGHHAEAAAVGAAPCQKAVGRVRELRIEAVVRAGMLHGVRQVRSRTVAGAATDQLVGVGDGDPVLGVGWC